MDFTTVLQAVSSVGFPIVACMVMYYTNEKQNEMHKEEMGKITEALNNNTQAITVLSERMRKEEPNEN